MSKLFSLVLAAGISTSVFAQDNIKSIEIGSDIPMAATNMKAADGKDVSLNGTKTNNGLLVMFSCNTCPIVIKSKARTLEMMNYAKEKGIGMIIVNSNEGKRDDGESLKDMAGYAKAEGYNVPYVLDKNSQLADAFGAMRTPEVFLFDGNGKLMYKGGMEDNPTNPGESKELYLKDAIDKIMMGAGPDPNTTKSIGCKIKRVS